MTKYSPKDFYELKLSYAYQARSNILPEEIEEIFIDWKNRIPKKVFSIIFLRNYRESVGLDKNYEK